MSFVMRDVEPENTQPADEQFAERTEPVEENMDEEGEFVAAEKKPINQTAMMLFAILTIGAAGIYVMNLRVGPQAAKASIDPTVTAAQTTITEFMERGSSNVSMLRKLLDSTARIVEQFREPNVVQVPLSDLKANPFHYASAVAATDDGSDTAKKRKEEEKLAIQTAARSLQLQTLVLRGNRKACMINNVLYQEGEQAEGFTIESISADSIIVRNGGYRFRLQMAH